MKTAVLLALLLNSSALLASDSFVFGEWFVNGAICSVNGRNIDCPNLNEKIKITKNISSCGSLQIIITAIEMNETRGLLLNSCENSTNEVNLFPTGYGYHYYNIERRSGRDVVLSASADFLEIYIYSSSVENGRFSRTYFLSKELIP